MTNAVDTGAIDHAAVIVLLAAGESRRYGGIKQLADIEGEPMVRRAARMALATGANVIVVTGAHADEVSAALANLPLRIAHHIAWVEGMGSSLAAGIRAVMRHFPFSSGALIFLGDQPLLTTEALNRLLARHRARPALLLATEQHQVAGPPALFPSDCFEELSRWSGSRGANALLDRERHRVELSSVDNGVDVDTQEDLRHALMMLAAIHPSTGH